MSDYKVVQSYASRDVNEFEIYTGNVLAGYLSEHCGITDNFVEAYRAPLGDDDFQYIGKAGNIDEAFQLVVSSFEV